MENNSLPKCSSKLHQEINAINYFQECRLYLCEKCQLNHQDLYDHILLNIINNTKEIHNKQCTEKNHINNLDFYCEKHNKLCCLACISDANIEGYGCHKNCKAVLIEDLKNQKNNEFKGYINDLNSLFNSATESIKELKEIFDEMNNEKEEMKIQIQKIFTKLRNELNSREEMLLMKIDEKFDKCFTNEENMRQYEKLPNKIQKSIDEIT